MLNNHSANSKLKKIFLLPSISQYILHGLDLLTIEHKIASFISLDGVITKFADINARKKNIA